jgi:hypothetical protein
MQITALCGAYLTSHYQFSSYCRWDLFGLGAGFLLKIITFSLFLD